MNQITTFSPIRYGKYQSTAMEYVFGITEGDCSVALTDLAVASKEQHWPSNGAEEAIADWLNILNNEQAKTNCNEAEKRVVIIWDERTNGNRRDENQPVVSH